MFLALLLKTQQTKDTSLLNGSNATDSIKCVGCLFTPNSGEPISRRFISRHYSNAQVLENRSHNINQAEYIKRAYATQSSGGDIWGSNSNEAFHIVTILDCPGTFQGIKTQRKK